MRFWTAFVLALAACGGSTDADVDVLSEDVTAGTLEASLGTLSVSVDSAGVFTSDDGRRTYVFAGRSSHELEGVSSWVPDDAFGRAELTSPHAFRIALDDHELNSLLAGLRLRVRLSVKGWKKQVQAGLLFAPRLEAGTGARELKVTPAVRPIFHGGQLAYRATATASFEPAAVHVEPAPSRVQRAGRTVQADFSYDALAAISTLTFEATTAGGAKVRRATRVIPSIVEVALTSADPERRWPMPVCAARVQACLDALPAGGLDASSCGAYGEVRVCAVRTLVPGLIAVVPPDALRSLEASANAVLRDGQRVILTAARYDWAALGSPSLAQVLGGVIEAEALAGAVNHGAVARDQLDAELRRFHLDALPAVIAEELHFDGLEAGRISFTTEAAAGTRDAHDLYVLSVPGRSAVYVAEVIEPAR